MKWLLRRERLSRLILAVEEITKTPLTPKFTKIKIPTKLSWSVKLSPDGKELALVSDKKLWKMPLSSNLGPDIPGTPVQVNTNGIEVEWSGLDWSRDGKWIAFNDYPKHDENGEYIENQSILVVPSSGGEPKKLIENFRSARVVNYRISLSPDAKRIAFSSIEENKQHIFSTVIGTDSSKQLVKMEAREPSYSPNGKYIAFVKDKRLGRGEGDLGLWVVTSNGGNPYKLADAGKASSPVWSPDGKMIAFLDYSEGTQINIIPFSKTENNRNKVIIDAPLGTEEVRLLAGWTPDNKIGALIVSKLEFGLYTLPSGGGQAALVLNDGQAMQPRWSRDGSQIYYVDTPKEGEGRSYRRFIASVPSSGGKGKPLQAKIDGESIKQFAYQSGNRISPDGKWIVTSTWTSTDTNTVNVHWPTSKIWKVSVDREDAIQITKTSGNFSDMSPSWSPDGKKVAFVRFKLVKGKGDIFGGDSKIYSINSAGGELEPLVSITGKYVNSVIWSPDGKMIAYLTKEINQPHKKNLNLYDFDKKESRIIEVQVGTVNNELVWSPDSKRIAFNDAEGKVIKIMNLDDGSVEDINTGLVDVNVYHLDWSPDGKRFVFGGYKGGEAEFWFMENFLPLKNEETAIKEPEGITIKQVWTGSGVDNTGKVSLDGKYLSFVDWETGDVAVRDLVKRENERLTNDGTWEEPYQFADLNIISPDGKQIAFQWYSGKNSNLKIIDINTKLTKTISTSEDGEIYPALWITDTEQLIAQRFNKIEDKYNSNLSSINIKTGEIKILRKFERKTFMSNITLSPDGKYIAFDFLDANMNDRFDINLVSIDGNEELSFIKHPANDRVLGWLPNSNKFIFTSNRTGTSDIWAVKTLANNSVSEPKRILTNVGNIKPLGFSLKGTLYYSTTLRKYNSYIIPNNQNSGELLLNSKTPLLGTIGDVSWLPDSNIVLCVEFKRKANNRQDYKLCLLNPETNEKHKLTDKIIVMGPPRLSPDNNLVLTQGWDENRIEEENYRGGIYTIELSSGNVSQINAKEDVSRSFSNEWSKDGKFIFYTSNNQIIKHEISTGEEHIIYSNEKLGMPVIRRSFGGNNLIFDVQMNDTLKHLKSISVNGGNEELLAKFNTSRTPLMFRKLTLSPDGKYIYLSVDDSESGSILWRVPSGGGEPVKIWHSKNKIAGIGIHPNGGEMAISLYEHEIEIRKIENLANEVEKIFSQNE